MSTICGTCAFWLRDRQGLDADGVQVYSEDGECRANPPIPISGGESAFPRTGEQCWCGDWVSRYTATYDAPTSISGDMAERPSDWRGL